MSKIISISLAALCLTFSLQAQDKYVYPAVLEMDEANAVWFNTDNAAGMIITPMASHEAVGVNYDVSSGNYRRYHDGNQNCFGVSADGASALGAGRVWGRFDYSNITVNESRYNTMSLNIDDDMPFRIVDERESYWKKQRYDLEMKASSPVLWDFLALGASAGYFSESGAKQVDPRGYGYECAFVVKPSAVMLFGKHSIGLVFDWETGNVRMGSINNSLMSSYIVYLLKGLGNSEESAVSLLNGRFGSVYETKNQLGASVQYGYAGDGLKLVAEGFVTSRDWDVCETPSKPMMLGMSQRTELGGKLQAVAGCGEFTHRLNAGAVLRKTNGIEFIQQFNKEYEVQGWEVVAQNVRSRYDHTEASLSYEVYSLNGTGYDWMAGLSGLFVDRHEEYILPNSVFYYTNCFGQLYGKKQFLVKDLSILAGVEAGYNKNLGGDYSYSGSSGEGSPVSDLYPNTLAYFTRDYFSCGLDASVSFPISNKALMSVTAEFKTIRTDDRIMDRRNVADLSVAFIF